LTLGINVNQFYMEGFKGVLDLKLENAGIDDIASVTVEVSSDLLTQTEAWTSRLSSGRAVYKKLQVKADSAGIELIQFRILAQAEDQVHAFGGETDIPVFERTQDLRNISIQADNIVGVGSAAQHAKSMGNAVRGQMESLIRMDKIKDATDLMREYRKMSPSYRAIDLEYHSERSRQGSMTQAKGNVASQAVGAGERIHSSRLRFALAILLMLGCMVLGTYWVQQGRAPGPGQGGVDTEHPNQVATGSMHGQEEQNIDAPQEEQETEIRPTEPDRRQQESSDPGSKAKAPGAMAPGPDSQTPEDREPRTQAKQTLPIVQSDLIVIVNCDDTLLLDYAQGLLRAGFSETGKSIEYLGDSQKASGTELQAKHAKVLAQNNCPFIIAKIQAVDQQHEVYGRIMPLSTVTVSLDFFDAGSRNPRKTVTKQTPKSSMVLAKARKDALELAMEKAVKEMLHELE